MLSSNVILSCCALLVSWSILNSKAEKMSWCDPELCPNGTKHTACENTGEFSEKCQPDAEIIDLKHVQDLIVHEHNKRRNFVALGLLPGYYPAARMATLKWDNELAFLAELNVRTCVVDHDDCKNTYRFRNVGQNLVGIARGKNHELNTTEIIRKDMSLWFEEHTIINSEYITKFKADSNFEKYGHFAEFVLQRNTHVGCAMMRYTHPELNYLYIYNFACNYASIYAYDIPVYNVGPPASECQSGTNPLYPALCSIDEAYNPNY